MTATITFQRKATRQKKIMDLKSTTMFQVLKADSLFPVKKPSRSLRPIRCPVQSFEETTRFKIISLKSNHKKCQKRYGI